MSARVQAIRALIAADFCLIPLNGKIPAVKDWRDTAPGSFGPANLIGNYGIKLGASDLIVDIDPRNFAPGDSPLARLVQAVGPLKSFTVRTGGGGLHVYLRKPADVLVKNSISAYPGIEFKSVGRQVVGPGSLHPDSGREYVVASGNPLEIADAPTALLALICRTAVPFDELNHGTGKYVNDAATQGRYLDFLQNQAEPSVQGKSGDNNAFRVAAHGRDLALPPAVTWELMLEVWNPRCSPPWDAEELKVKVINAYKFSTGAVGNAHPEADFDVVPAREEKPKEPEISWDTTRAGDVKKSFVNLLNYMRLPAGGLYKTFAFNDFTGRVEFANPAPWHRGRLPFSRGVGDLDLKLLKGFLASRHNFEMPVSAIEEAVSNVAYHDRFHPVREYLEGLKWDGTPRADTWLRDYLGAVDGGYPEYLAAVSRKVLCAAVMRAMRPGVKFDHVLVLEGAQDIGKSSVVGILGGDWASDAPVDPHNRDTVDAMQGRWIIEMAEMEVLRKTDEDALKAFITRQTDRVRLAYGRTTGEFPRQSIFIATKNPRADGTYLKDETGGRRWWPVRCDPQADRAGIAQVNFKGLQVARNQLFAEAVHIVRTTGERLFMETATLKAQAKAVVAQRHADHEWTDRIAAWLDEKDASVETRRDFWSTRDIFVDAMGGVDKQLDRRSSLAVAQCMKTLGWTHELKWVKTRPVRGYARPGFADATVTAPTTEKTALDSIAELL